MLLPDDSGPSIHSSLCSEFGKCSEHNRLGFDMHQPEAPRGAREACMTTPTAEDLLSDQVHRIHRVANRAVPQLQPVLLASSPTSHPASLTDGILHNPNSLTATPPALSAPLHPTVPNRHGGWGHSRAFHISINLSQGMEGGITAPIARHWRAWPTQNADLSLSGFLNWPRKPPCDLEGLYCWLLGAAGCALQHLPDVNSSDITH